MLTQKKKEEELAEDSVLDQTPVFRAPVPRMSLWPTTRSGGRASTPTADDWATDSIFETPVVATRRARNRKRKAPPGDEALDPTYVATLLLWTRANLLSILVTPERLEDEDNEGKATDPPVDSAIKLKGVFWPGMDLFDSATPAQKKRRNQKKEVKVLKNLMAISEEVVPLQVSYYANGEVRESRDIFGPLSDNEDLVSILPAALEPAHPLLFTSMFHWKRPTGHVIHFIPLCLEKSFNSATNLPRSYLRDQPQRSAKSESQPCRMSVPMLLD